MKKVWRGGGEERNGNGRRVRRKNGARARNTAYVGVRTKYSGVGGREGCCSSSINTHYRQPLRVPRRPSSISFTPDTISLPHFEPPLLLSSVRMLEKPVSFSCTRLIARQPRKYRSAHARVSRAVVSKSVRGQLSILRFEGSALCCEGKRGFIYSSRIDERVGFGDRLVRMKRSLRFSRLCRDRFTSSKEHWTRVNGRVRYRLYRRTVKQRWDRYIVLGCRSNASI